MANRYASQQSGPTGFRSSLDALVACAPMTSLVSGVGLGIAGYLAAQPGVAASGALVAATGLYVERLQARSLRRRRRAERMRNRHEVTELRRTIAQLRVDVGAFQRALLDTEAALAARDLPLLPQPAPVPVATTRSVAAAPVAPVRAPAAAPAPAPAPAATAAPVQPVPAPAPAPVPAPSARLEPVVVGEGWVQTRDRDVAEAAQVPLRPFTPFVAGPGGVSTAASDALVYAALTEMDEEEATRDLAYAAHQVDSATQETRSA